MDVIHPFHPIPPLLPWNDMLAHRRSSSAFHGWIPVVAFTFQDIVLFRTVGLSAAGARHLATVQVFDYGVNDAVEAVRGTPEVLAENESCGKTQS